MDDSSRAQCYSLMITKENGDRMYGYCRRVIPEGSKNCLPLVYCILSKHRAAHFYRRILEEIETRHGLPDKLTENFINEFYSKPFPSPGESITIDVTKIIPSEDCRINQNNAKNKSNNELIEEAIDALDLNSYVIVENKGAYGTLRKVNAGIYLFLQYTE